MPQQACDAVRAAASKSIACKAQVAKEVTHRWPKKCKQILAGVWQCETRSSESEMRFDAAL